MKRARQTTPSPRFPRQLFALGTCVWAVLCLVACRPHTLYHHFEPVSPGGWQATDTLRFELPPARSGRLHTLSLGLRFNEQLRYRDLYLVVEQRSSGSRRDTLHMPLANERGKWQARGVVLHDRETVVTATRLDTTEQTEVLVYHIMSPQVITGITEVGLKAE